MLCENHYLRQEIHALRERVVRVECVSHEERMARIDRLIDEMPSLFREQTRELTCRMAMGFSLSATLIIAAIKL